MSTFISMLTLTLQGGEEEIPGLENGSYESVVPRGAQPVERLASRNLILKVLRLQTLLAREDEQKHSGSLADDEATAEVLGKCPLEISVMAMKTNEEAFRRQEMLERLIVEVVRDALPIEVDRGDVRYLVSHDFKLMWAPPRQRGSTW